jgi:hypothetical protein
MFTLKLGKSGTHEGDSSWIGDIDTIHRIGLSTGAEYRKQFEHYLNGPDCWNLTGAPSDDEAVTLFSVVRSNGSQFYVVSRIAWLLGPDGNTIERIAP